MPLIISSWINRKKQDIAGHFASDKQSYCPGCGEKKTLRWPRNGEPAKWCSQRCAASAASKILVAEQAKALRRFLVSPLFCVYYGIEGCTKSNS